jgi:hypothetical protein
MPSISVQPLSRILLTAFALLSLALVPVATAGKPTPPPPPPPPVTYTASVNPGLTLWRVNEEGAAVGWTTTGSLLAMVRLADGTLVDLNDVALESDPNYEWSLLDYALAINDAGQIAGRGWRVENGVPQARLFRFTPESVDLDTGLPIPARLEAIRVGDPTKTLFVKGMNNRGDVVLHASASGQDTIPAQPRAGSSVWVFFGPAGQGTASLLLDSAVPGGINDFGEVTGALESSGGTYAFIAATDGTYDLFGTINGATTSMYDVSEGAAINDAGAIVGWARMGKTKREDTSMRAVRLNADSTWDDLTGTASGANSRATGLNSSGVTVGSAGGINGLGFITVSGKAWSVKDLITNPPPGLKYISVKDITDSGVLCGSVTVQNPDGTTSEAGALFIPSSIPAP